MISQRFAKIFLLLKAHNHAAQKEIAMLTEYINYILAFLEGFALIISPCILPVLPIILSGSVQGGKKRPYGVILGFVIAFILFTMFSRKLVLLLGINLNIIREASFLILLVFGAILISNYLTEKFELLTQKLANIGSSWKIISGQNNNGFLSGLLFGGLIGLIWTPCAGPILAAVILQAILQKTNIASFLTIVFFGIGVGIPMLIVVILGRKITNKLNIFKTHALFFRRLLGCIIIASVIYMVYGTTVTSSLTKPMKNNFEIMRNELINPLRKTYSMPEIKGIAAWLNSSPLNNAQLKGKVVLVDFWTYSCINCIRTLPYLKDWYAKYQDKGLIIIGIHSPEFEFEKDLTNVKNAVSNFGIKYPVALDNDYATWMSFNNSAWPAHYLVNKDGYVVYEHFGEGEYDVTENNIRFLLGMNAMPTHVTEESYCPQTPETYLGYERAGMFKSPELFAIDKSQKYTYPVKLNEDAWALQGDWTISAQKIIANSAGAAIKIHFRAGKVFAVMGNSSSLSKPITVHILLDGKPIPQKIIEVTDHKLYTIIDSTKNLNGVLELIAAEPGLEIYTFTFGGCN